MMHNVPAKVPLVLFFTLAVHLSFGQANTNEPYSRYGFGIIQPNYFGQSRAMGGVSAGLREDNTINIANPASYPAIHVTTLESGLRASFLSLQSNTGKEKSVDGSFAYLALGFPLSPKWSMVLSLVPYSNMGYNQTLAGSDFLLGPTKAIYNGQGGLTQAFMGHGFTVAKGLSLGFNAGYVFGNLQTQQALEFQNAKGSISDSVYNSRFTSTIQLGGFNFEYGLQYTIQLKKDARLTFGYSGSYGNTLITREKLYLERYSSNVRGNEVVLDTILNTPKPFTYSYLPTKNAFGVSYRFQSRWLVAADVNYDDYSKVIFNGSNPGFRNALKGSIGAQYTPDVTSVSNYLDLLDYRVGLTFGKTYLNVHEKDINQVALTFGVGIPIRPYTQSQVGAKINLGFEIGQLGTINAANVLQKYVNVHVGFVLNQLWFYRYRYQ